MRCQTKLDFTSRMTAFFGIMFATSLIWTAVGLPVVEDSIIQSEKSQVFGIENESSQKKEEIKNMENPRKSLDSQLIPCSSFQQMPKAFVGVLPVCDPKN